MLAIGRALMTNPKLLILDEATEGLAPLIRAEIWACLKRLKAKGQAILVIDKNVDALTRFADRHVIIEKGRTVWTGTSAALPPRPGWRTATCTSEALFPSGHGFTRRERATKRSKERLTSPRLRGGPPKAASLRSRRG